VRFDFDLSGGVEANCSINDGGQTVDQIFEIEQRLDRLEAAIDQQVKRRISRTETAKVLHRSVRFVIRRQADDSRFPKPMRDEAGRYWFWPSEVQKYRDECFQQSA
jgi:hypothetical protein